MCACEQPAEITQRSLLEGRIATKCNSNHHIVSVISFSKHVSHSTHAYRHLQHYVLSMQMFELLGAREFLPQRQAASDLYGKMCAQAPTFCLQAIEAICGYNDANINTTRLPLYLSYTPAGAQFAFEQVLCSCACGLSSYTTNCASNTSATQWSTS